MVKNRVEVYDIETLCNCFTYTGTDRDSDDTKMFVIWHKRNDLPALLDHLDTLKGQIGYNNLEFDYPVIHHILKNRDKFLTYTGKRLAKEIYKKAQKVIDELFSMVKEVEVLIPQLDLYKIWHYDNNARRCSLKKLEIAMQFPNVQDMPYAHDQEIETEEQVQEILSYNKNDVEATKTFYTKTLDKLELRRGLRDKYGINCMNFSDSKIGEELVLKLYCEHTSKPIDEVRKMRTFRKGFRFRECIPDYVSFETPEFNELLEYLKGIEVTELKDSFKYSFSFGDAEFDLGTGGIHMCIKPGIYKSTDKECIVDADVGSLYPNLAITNGLYPYHLGKEFLTVYEDNIVKPRMEAKKRGDKTMADGLKISANATYGKSNSMYSFLYDPLYTLKTTLAGQLALCMLSEMLMTKVPNLKVLQVNTDGITVMIPIEYKRLYWEVCQEWEKTTKLGLEYVAYQKMVIRDVNNYLSQDVKGKVKYKGAFKPREEMIKDGEYHKSLSQCVVTHALSEFYLKDIPVADTIYNHQNIYDFCKTFNASHGWKCETVGEDENDSIPQQKNNRYFISKEGRRFRKFKDEKQIDIEANKKVTIFNTYYEAAITEYGIDYDYYIDECRKIIEKIDGTEERLAEKARAKREEEKRNKEFENFRKFCLDKVPTNKQLETYGKEWLVETYGKPQTKEEIKELSK